MAGIYGVFLKELNPKKGVELLGNNLIRNEYIDDHGIIGRAVLNKLSQDRFLETKNQVSICFEGVNLSDHITDPKHFFEAYAERGISFIDDLKGTFSGFVYDAEIKKIYVFNDHLSTKNIYYYYDKGKGFIFSSGLNPLASLLREQNISYSLNEDAVYMMALYGFLLEDHTYVKEIKKLPYSSLLSFDIEENVVDIEKRFSYSSETSNMPYSKALDQVNSIFEYAVAKDWNKDLEYSNKHLTMLSGGMDARTNLIIAKDLGFEDVSSFTFGHSSSKDVQYAAKIALGEGTDHFQRFLNSPAYLTDKIMENYVVPNDGMMMFHTSAHASSTVRKLNLDPFPVLHTGQIGDVLFGSSVKENFDFHKNRASLGYTGFIADSSLLDKIQSLPEILDKYQELGIELFTLEQRQINATLVGDRSLNTLIDCITPFFNLDLISLCLSIPDKYKRNQVLYFDWLKKYHPRALSYPWENIQLKPNNKYKIIYGKLYKKYFNGAKKYFGLNYDSMNPYNTWLRNDPSIIQTLDAIFEKEIQRTYISADMKKDLKSIYAHNIFEFRNKFAVITALLSMKLYFEHVE